MKVFVYGTLKDGHGNNAWMPEGAELLTRDTVHNHAIYDLGPFPAVTKEVGEYVIGEVWEVSSLDRLDILEGYPELYNRKVVQTESGHEVWMYFMHSLEHEFYTAPVEGREW